MDLVGQRAHFRQMDGRQYSSLTPLNFRSNQSSTFNERLLSMYCTRQLLFRCDICDNCYITIQFKNMIIYRNIKNTFRTRKRDVDKVDQVDVVPSFFNL